MELSLESRIEKLEKRTKFSESAIYIIVFIILGIAIIFNFAFTLSTPGFKETFADLLEGEPLPGLTALILNYSFYALIIDLIFTIILISLYVMKKVKYFLPLGIIFIIIILMKAAMIVIGLMLPLNRVIEQLN